MALLPWLRKVGEAMSVWMGSQWYISRIFFGIKLSPASPFPTHEQRGQNLQGVSDRIAGLGRKGKLEVGSWKTEIGISPLAVCYNSRSYGLPLQSESPTTSGSDRRLRADADPRRAGQ